jgi:hypothetical protein
MGGGTTFEGGGLVLAEMGRFGFPGGGGTRAARAQGSAMGRCERQGLRGAVEEGRRQAAAEGFVRVSVRVQWRFGEALDELLGPQGAG